MSSKAGTTDEKWLENWSLTNKETNMKPNSAKKLKNDQCRKTPRESASYYKPIEERLESDSDENDYMEHYLSLSRAHGCPKSSESESTGQRIRPKTSVLDPMFEMSPCDRLVRSGENVKFVCKVRGTKPLEVFWYKLNESSELVNNEKYEIYHDDEFYYLKLFNTVPTDAGVYLCVISNTIDQNIDSFQLQLRGSLLILMLR